MKSKVITSSADPRFLSKDKPKKAEPKKAEPKKAEPKAETKADSKE